MNKKLLILDGMAITYRAYYALSRTPRITSKGLNTSAIMGFTTTLFELIKSQNPTHIGVAFDLAAPTFRHEMYQEYKANREAMPEDIQQALPYIRQVIGAFNIPILTCEGYEADDVIGTLAHKAERHGFEVLMVTPDKDFAQLVTENIKIYRFGRFGKKDEILGVNEVLEKFSISNCSQVIDILGLWGDTADNIPGIPGIGEKKAQQLVNEFGSIENLVENYSRIPNEKLRLAVEQNIGQALLSKKLATIVLDVPIDFNEDELKLELPDFDRMKELFDELEFKSLSKRIFTDYSLSHPELVTMMQNSVAPATPAPSQPTLFDAPSQPDLFSSANRQTSDMASKNAGYRILHDESEIVECLKSLEKQTPVAVYFLHDSEKIWSVAFAAEPEKAFYFELANLPDSDELKQFLDNEHVEKVCYGSKVLKRILAKNGIPFSGKIFDVEIAHYLLNSESRHSYDFIFSSMLSQSVPEIADKSSKDGTVNFAFIDAALLQRHACMFADFLCRLHPIFSENLADTGNEHLFYDVEMPLVDVLLSMENEGVRIDTEYLRKYSMSLQEECRDIENRIYELSGERFNIKSPKQLGEVLFTRMKIVDKAPKTATKQFSTAEDVLQKLADKHPVVPLILEYRSLSKLINTYLDSFPKLISSADGRLHTVYNQTVTATGRLSSSNPNLQNIPIRTERGREIRKAFVPRSEDYVLLAADYSQIELRIIASLSGDRNMQEAFLEKYDIHAATAAKIYGLPLDEVPADLRRKAKSVNFGIIYGISAFGLSEQLHIPRKEASELIEEYFVQYPDIKHFIETSVEKARQKGYAETLMGRRRQLPDLYSRNNNIKSFAERNAVNTPIQGTSADMIKIAMNGIFAEFGKKNLKSRMILQVHDELVFDVYKPELEEVKRIVSDKMINALPLSIPVELGIDVGENWLEAH